MTEKDIERLIQLKKEQLQLAVERHEFLEQYELEQDIKALLEQRKTAEQRAV